VRNLAGNFLCPLCKNVLRHGNCFAPGQQVFCATHWDVVDDLFVTGIFQHLAGDLCYFQRAALGDGG